MSSNSNHKVRWCGLVLLLVSAMACVDRRHSDSGMGSETNWLGPCDEDSDCDEGSCLCGVCTIECASDSECGEVGTGVECITTPKIVACLGESKPRLCGQEDTPFESAAEAGGDTTAEAADAGDDDAPTGSDSKEGERDASTAVTSATSSGTDGDRADDGTPSTPGPEPTDSEGTDPASPPSSAAARPTKADVLFVVDNSRGMVDKQAPFAAAAPEFVQQIYNPDCVSEGGERQAMATPQDACPQGYARPFAPITDIHVGVITTSLGGYGAEFDCKATEEDPDSVQLVDMAELLGGLPRGAAAAPLAAETGFLSWGSDAQSAELGGQLTQLITSAGTFGCGWEAPLEAWYRFLVEPYPHVEIVRQACSEVDTALSCAGPSGEGDSQRVNSRILEQRQAFLRPDSLLTIVTMSDENDCSFKAKGQIWRLAQSAASSGEGAINYYPTFKGTAACSDPTQGPNSECCHSCGSASVPESCPTTTDQGGLQVALGCEDGRKFTNEDVTDNPNLRCFAQKQRFGVDYLYPVERYANALTQTEICPLSDSLSTQECAELGTEPVTNPLFAGEQPRPPEWIVFASLVGAPWQDVAVTAEQTTSLELRSTNPEAASGVEWDWLIGEREPQDGFIRPLDPLMIESVLPRTGMNPATGEPLAAPDSGFMANSSNGHEWSIVDHSDLQFACTFALPEPRVCLTPEEIFELSQQGVKAPDCACSQYGSEFQNPLCQDEADGYSMTQTLAGAYPGIRQLQVSYDVSSRSVVGSICPKVLDEMSPDHGYRPFVRALLRRFDEVLPPAGE